MLDSPIEDDFYNAIDKSFERARIESMSVGECYEIILPDQKIKGILLHKDDEVLKFVVSGDSHIAMVWNDISLAVFPDDTKYIRFPHGEWNVFEETICNACMIIIKWKDIDTDKILQNIIFRRLT